jgi:phage tail-like protein
MNRAESIFQRLVIALVMSVALFAAPAAYATNFAVLLGGDDGVETQLEGVESIEIDDIVFDERPFWMLSLGDAGVLAAAQKEGYRVSGPGDAHFGSITIRARVGKNRELQQWWLDTTQGKNIRKYITVLTLKADGTEGRRWNMLECFPTRWDPGEYSPSSNKSATETIVCKMQRVELAVMDDGEPDGNVVVSAEGEGSVISFGMSMWAGGEPGISLSSFLNRARHRVSTPGHKYVGTLALRGPLTDGRGGLCQWINESVKGQPWKRTLTITENLPGKREGKPFTYLDCYPVRYVFPTFNADGTGNLYEEVHIKPIRMDIA